MKKPPIHKGLTVQQGERIDDVFWLRSPSAVLESSQDSWSPRQGGGHFYWEVAVS